MSSEKRVSNRTSQRISRRAFVGGTAAGLTAPLILPRLAAAQGSNDKLTVAAIGVGGRGSEIGNHAARIGKAVACCDVDRRNAENFAAKRKEESGDEVKIYADYRELLSAEKDVDVVTIGTPDHWHVKIAIEALQAGKHVYCEKPLTLTIEEGELIKKAVDKYGKTFQVGTQQRSEFNRDFLTAVALVHLGRLGGNLKAISSVGRAASRRQKEGDKTTPFGPFDAATVPDYLNWDLWQGPAATAEFVNERVGWNFRWWFEYSGGQVTDWGVHHTDIAFWALAGAKGQAVSAQGTGAFMGVEREKVLAFLTGKSTEPLPQAWNTAFEFDVDIALSTGNTIKLTSGENQLLIEGDAGRIRVNRGSLTGKPVEDMKADAKLQAEVTEKMAELYGGELPKDNLPHMQNFFDCIASGKAPVANVHDHVRSVNACHLANIALVTGRKVEFDPASGTIKNDAEANAMVARKRREGYDIVV
jgi:myo-inositol 2-dehydrogenase / D-chiro-inositol 1-dehydrogenase